MGFRNLFWALCAAFFLLSIPAACQSSRAISYFKKAQQAASDRNYSDARRNINKALDADPNQCDLWLFSADLAYTMGQDDLALEHYQKAAKAGVQGALHFRVAEGLFKSGDYARAAYHAAEYQSLPTARDPYASRARLIEESCAFALKAQKDPKPYNPKNLGDAINTPELEYQPGIQVDGNTLIFTRRSETGPRQDEDFYSATRVDTTWQTAEPLLGLNTTLNEGAMCISADGKIMLLTKCLAEDGLGSCDIYFCVQSAPGKWTRPRNLGPNINSARWETQPTLSADGRTLIFVRGNSRDEQSADLYVSYLQDNGQFSVAKPLPGEVNTSGKESSPFLHFDGRTLYFSSNGHPGFGNEDFFVSRMTEKGVWGKPENLGYPINTRKDEVFLIVAGDGRTGYFASSGFPDTRGKLDLYTFQLPEEARSEAVAWLEGTVVDAKTGEYLEATLQLQELEDTTAVSRFGVSPQVGLFAVLPGNRSYAVTVNKPGYLFYSAHFALGEEGQEKAYRLDVKLQPIEKGAKMELRNVFFDTDKDVLKPASHGELNQLVALLQANPNMRIEVSGHTDNQGSSAYNLQLSARRAKAVVKYLTSRGIDAGRLVEKGYGDTLPMASNDTEEGRALNRRTEVRVL